MEVANKKTLKQRFKIYWPFSLCTLQQALSYKASFFLFIIAELLGVFASYYLWRAIFQSSSSPTINNFTFREMVIYIFISFITTNIVWVNVSREIGYDVVEGSIAINLIKPINYKIRLFFSSLGGLVYNFFVPSIFIWIGLMIYEYTKYHTLPPNIFTILLYLLSIILSFILLFFFDFCFSMLAFYTTYIWGLNLAKAAILAFLSGQVIPLTFFPGIIQKVFQYLPFASMNYVPVMIYMRKLTGVSIVYELARQVMWIVLLWLLSCALWKQATKRITVLGG